MGTEICGRCVVEADICEPVTAGPSLPQGRQHGGNASHHAEYSSVSVPGSAAPSREPSMTRGRTLNTGAGKGASARSQTPGIVTTKSNGPALEGALERKPSLSYGHHRQTSIVHGVQHSRNPSHAQSPTTSPLSPHMIAAAAGMSNLPGGPFDGVSVPEDELAALPTANGHLGSTNGTLKYSHSAVTLAGSDGMGGETMRRPERMHSVKSRRDHHRSQSRHPHQQELKTVGEYALHHLFNSFVGQADQKINECVGDPKDPEPQVELICGPGVDPSFDKLISALGHIARQKPKPLIDTLMFWRKAKSEAANNARMEYNQGKLQSPPTGNFLPRRNTEPVQTLQDAQGPPTLQTGGQGTRQLAIVQAERRSTVSIYLLCRVLIEIISQSNLACITLEMADRLEDIIFTQLTLPDLESLEESPLKKSNWLIFAQLLGVMSDVNFDSVSNRFLQELNRNQIHLDSRGANDRLEGKVILALRGMRYLRVKHQPDDAWDRTCDFMQMVAKLFANAHGQIIKFEYCNLLKELLLPLTAKVTSEFNMPKWRNFLEITRPRVSALLSKNKHWQGAFPLMCVLTCASPFDMFSSQWLQLIQPLQPKLKELSTRAMALRGICRLVWTYLYRVCESQSATSRRLEEIIRLVFVQGRKSYLSTETAIAEPFIQLARIIGFKYQDVCFRTVIFSLMNSDMFASGRELRPENLEPERMVIGIRAFLAVMADLETGEAPPFPTVFDKGFGLEPSELLPSPLSPRNLIQIPSKSTTVKEERLSRPVMVTTFGDTAKESYIKFCKILGDITIICDNAFGGQAVLDEKFSLPAPKTPMTDAFTFVRRDDHQNSPDFRQGFYDLLHVAVQALPRCLSPHIPFNSLVNLLCTGTAHVQSNIAASSAQSLKSIARQSHAQQVTIGFARFIFNFDDRYATMSDGGMLGAGHIESTLRLYVELLQIWIEEIKQKTKKAASETLDDTGTGSSSNRGAQLDLSGVWAHVEEIESHGLFFLCSPSRRVRSFAVTVLRLITEFDTALGSKPKRIIRIMEGGPETVMDVNDEKLSVAERSRIQRSIRKSTSKGTLVDLCSSDAPYDATLWFKVFPNLIGLSFELCPFAVTLTRELICERLVQMHRTVAAVADGPRSSPYPNADGTQMRSGGKMQTMVTSPPEVVIEQWQLHLIFACKTLTNIGGQQQLTVQNPQHVRKSSKTSQYGQDKIHSADDLFARVIPFLCASNASVREAAVVGLGSININLYRTLLESLQTAVDESRIRLGLHQRSISSPRNSKRTEHLRTEVAHVYRLTSYFLREPEAHNDDWILKNLVNYTKDLRIFLNDAEVQHEWEYQKLRTHFCGLLEELFEGINRTKDPIQWMPFQARKAAFALLEEWCGFSPNQNQIRQREDHIRRSILDREADVGNKGIVTAAIEIEKRDLRTAALSGMAALCGGPLIITTEGGVNLQFDIRRLFSWIDAIFDTPSDKTHTIGRRALKNLVIHNRDLSYLLTRAVEMCYLAKSSKARESYFEVVSQILIEYEDLTLPFWKSLGAGLYILGNENNELRMKSARLLRTLEERQQKSSKLQDLDISVSDKTIAVYKTAQFEISRRLASKHSELAFHVLSELSFYFKELQPDCQRSMIAALLPWIQIIELQLDPNGGPTAHSYMVLVNLFEITVRCGNALHNEIQALWQALASSHGGNVQLILDFIMSLCLERRENFVHYAKQIVVYLSSIPAGQKVVEFLLMQINPKTMIQEKREPTPPPQDVYALPYVADLSLVITSSGKQSGFSLGQLCLILLVDLMVSPVNLTKDQVPLLLHVVLTLWDHYMPLVQDQAREMLVHLIHELVISKVDDANTALDKSSVEDLIELFRGQDATVVWAYDDHNGTTNDDDSCCVPDAMTHVMTKVLDIFSTTYPTIREDWGKVTLEWATSCSVRHVACRSLQIFRCIQSKVDQTMLGDLLVRLSNTIADDENDVQAFSLEILTTLRVIIQELDGKEVMKFPQFFWATCACLETIHEREFLASLSMLDKLMDKLDLSDPTVIKLLVDNFPPNWEGPFEGVTSLIYKGIRSSVCLDRSLTLLERLVVLPSSDLVGDEFRLAFNIFANLPRFLNTYGKDARDPAVTAAAETLRGVAESQGCLPIARVLSLFAQARYRISKDFLAQTISAVRMSFFPNLEYESLVFLIGLLSNKLPWFKIRLMEILCCVIPDIDLRKPEISAKGPDLISPLLRLLQTEFCPQALQVLDHVMSLTGTPTPLDKHHLRMSMAGSHSSRAFRKEYDRTQSLYGIPEDTGWSIPIPAVHSSSTRKNCHMVFYTCATAQNLNDTDVDTPKVEFLSEEYQYPSYFPDYRTATMTSEDTRGDGHLGELVMKLDSLDDFFEDDADVATPMAHLSPSASRFQSPASSPVDIRETLYDQQTLPILHKSLTQNASVTSFQNGFTDMKLPVQTHGIMTPTAFTTHNVSPNTSVPAVRPGLHTRSITSPSSTQPGQHSAGIADYSGDELDEPFSDDELRTPYSGGGGGSGPSSGSAGPHEKPFSFEKVRPFAAGTRSGFRAGMRRLTGGSGDAKERERARDMIRQQLQKSPQVPKVPDIYLQNPKSSDL